MSSLPDSKQPLRLAPLVAADAKPLTSLALVATSHGPAAFGSKTLKPGPIPVYEARILPLSLDDGSAGPPLFTIEQMLPALARWDLRARPDGGFVLVMENAGGAINALFVMESGRDERQAVNAKYPFQSFSGPRFVKRAPQGAAPPVSAVVDGKHVVVFPGHGGYGESLPIADGDAAVLVQGPDGVDAFFKVVAPGSMRADVLPGVLHHVRLDAGFHPVGPVTRPLGDRVIFEVDADRLGSGVAVFATGRDRPILVVGAPPDRPFEAIVLDYGQHDPRRLSRPAIAANAARVTVAVLEATEVNGIADARLLAGRVDVDPAP